MLFVSPKHRASRGFLDARSGPAAEAFFFFLLIGALLDEIKTDTLGSWWSHGTHVLEAFLADLIEGCPLPHLLPKDESQYSAACPAGAGSRLPALCFLSSRFMLVM